MEGTKDIKNFTKFPSLSDDDLLLGSKTSLGGTDASITVANFKKQVVQDVKPTIVNGYWWVDNINTGVLATGRTPKFRKTSSGLEMKYEDQDDTAYILLIPMSDLAFTFDDLSPEQVEELKLKFSDLTDADKEALRGAAFTYDMFTDEQLADLRLTWDKLTPDQKNSLKGDRGYSAFEVWTQQEGNVGKTVDDYLAWLRQPATDAAADARTEITNMRQLEATVEEEEEKRGNSYTQWQAAEQGRQNDEIKRKEEFAQIKTDAETATGKANAAALNADLKAKDAEEQANYAKEQGEFAQQQIGKVSKYDSRITALEEGKVDGGYAEENMLYLTVDGVPVGDPIPVGSGTGGGGGSAGITCKVKSITDTLLSTVSGASVRIGYNFTSVYADDGSETGDGTATYTINSQKVATQAITQGDNYFDVSKWLVIGTNKVKVTVLDSTGQSRSLAYTVEVISLSLADSYDDTLVNTGDITYRYTPVGAIAKTVHFNLDGKEIATKETTDSNRQLSQVIPAQSHGAHRLVVYMTATVNGVEVRSNELAHDLICVTTGNNTVIVASSFNLVTAQQYDRLSIPFVVYNPAASTAAVTLSVDGVILSEQTVDRTLQTWTYRIAKPGALVLKIASGSVSKTFDLDVTEAGVVVEAETADLSLFLTSANRSNNDNNKEEWKYKDYTAALTDFNFKTNGWITENGSTALRVSGDARVTIPYHIFANDFRATGKTIEFEFATRDVIDYEATVINCLAGNIGLKVTAQQALFKSEQTSVDTRFKEEERVRISFTVEKKTDHRLIYIFINGVMSGVAQYPEDDNFQQSEPVGITIGSNDCTVDIYNIRVYDNNLTQYQSLDNYMADIDDYDKKVTIYNKNQVYNAYGDISYDATLNLVPGLIIIGELPQYKGDKKTVTLLYTDKQHPERSFIAYNVQIDVQGTSSQYYPRKNYKFKFKSGLTMLESGEEKEAYPLRPDSIPATAFCTKADFAESSGTHNTGMAVIIDKLLKDMDILTPPQKENNKVRTTIDGFPICIFHRVTDDSDIEFVGKYNFNYDKSAENTFGFAEGDESWEFCNNTSNRVLFKSADFSGTDWMNDFEARYPDDDVINGEYEAGTRKPVNLMEVAEWVVSTKDDADKFKAEVTDHFDLNNLLAYYLITEIFAMVDQRAKNMFLTRFHGDNKWRFIFYDNDTCFGINNEGLIAFGFNVEYHDKLGAQDVFNGESSVLWKNVEACFPAEIEAMYKDIRSKGYLSYSYVMSVLNGEQSDKWCEAIYNADGRFKYIDPLINEGNGSYLYAAQGSREEHRKWWTYNRFLYMDSKYTAGDFLSDFATLRLYTPANWGGVAPSANFTMVPFANSYVRIKYGSYIVGQRCEKNAVVNIQAPAIQFNDTETIVYGASRIKSLGDLSGMYAGSVDVSKATRLSELIIGSSAEGYHNDNLTVLAVGSNKMLRKLDIRNCPNLKQAVDLSGCENIEEVYAQGTAITSVVLPAAGILSKLYLPATLTNLTLKNQPKLSDAFFEIAGVEKLSTIISENTNGVNIFPVVDRCLSMKNPALSRVRLIDLNATGANLDILYKLIKLGGVDEKGNNVATAVVTGKFHAVTAVEDKLAAIRAAFPELTVTYTNLKAPTVTTFTFSSAQGHAIKNSTFECNFDAVKVNEYTYKVTADDDSVIDFTFKCDNHEDYSDTYLVAGTRSQSYEVPYIPLRTITVQVYSQSVYVANARIVIGSDVYVTNTNGYVSLKRGGEAVEGTVEAAGYAGNTFSFPAIVSDTTNYVYVYAAVDIKFIVKDDYARFVKDAIVSCNGRQATTNMYGECTLQIAKGTYSYEIEHPSYFSKTDTVTVGTSASTINANIVFNAESLRPEESGNIQMMVIGPSVNMSVNSTDSAYLIDWGDGTTDNAIGIGTQTYSHTYSDSKFYQIEIKESSNVVYAIGDKSSLIAYWSVGNSQVNNLSFNNYSKLSCVGTIFKNDESRSSFKSSFSSCSKLRTIPSNLFANCYSATTFNMCFYDCSLIAIPNGLFDDCHAATDFSGCFYKCKSLISIPAGLFDNCSEAIDFSTCFSTCTSLRTIPAELFDNCSKAKRFGSNSSNGGCFAVCQSVDVLPALWEKFTGDDIVSKGCFTGCEWASNWLEVPFTWGGPKITKTITLKVFKDNAWYLNQRVKVGDSLLTQNADGTYSILYTGLETVYLDVSVNDEVVGCLQYKGAENINSIILLGDCSTIATIYDYTTGDTHEDIIESNSTTYPWVYSEELGGFRSAPINTSSAAYSDLVLNLPAASYCVILGYSIPETIWEYLYIYEDTAIKWKNTIGSTFKDDILVGSISEKIKFSFYKYKGNGKDHKDCAWIKKIYALTNPPALPENFTPIPAALLAMNGSVIADYKAVNYRLTRVENALGFND